MSADAVLMASEQPAGKMSTDDEVTPFNTSTAETHVPDAKHIDPDAQVGLCRGHQDPLAASAIMLFLDVAL